MSTPASLRVESIQIGAPADYAAGSGGRSGIDKMAVDRAEITETGLVGDHVVDLVHHGGVDQAVYVYGRVDYAFWEATLGRPLVGGSFGENVTLDGLACAELSVGDRFDIAGVVLEVTAARIPCAVFRAKVDEPGWQDRFRDARRPGCYCRVIVPGAVVVGDPVRITQASGPTITLLETQDLYYDRAAGEERLAAALASPISERQRTDLQRRISKYRLDASSKS